MFRLNCLLLLMIFGLLAPVVRAADLIGQVPLDSTAYPALRLLHDQGMLPDARPEMFEVTRVLTRYDFAFLLVEPLERLSALVEAQRGTELSPETRRRADFAAAAMAPLTGRQRAELFAAAGELATAFTGELELLSPGLAARATTALGQLKVQRPSFWDRLTATSATILRNVHFSIDPTANPNPVGTPLPISPGVLTPTPSRMVPDPLVPVAGTNTTPFTARPLTSLEAAVDLALGKVNIYSSVKALPGQDPISLLNPDGSGRAMVGVRLDLGNVNDFGICGIFEYHVLRTGTPDNPDVATGAVGGIGINW